MKIGGTEARSGQGHVYIKLLFPGLYQSAKVGSLDVRVEDDCLIYGGAQRG